MKELDCLLGPCLDAFLKSSSGFASVVLFGSIILVSLFFIIKKDSIRSRIKWSYPLIFSILFLLSFFMFSMTCQSCTARSLLYSIPVAVIGLLIFEYIIIPNIYLAINKVVLSKELSETLPEYIPVYIADNGKPFAFSYSGLRKWIVVSQGMIELLNEKELNSVLLHEYGHIANNSSFYKSSNWLYSKIPLLRAFLDNFALEDEEEKRADQFAIEKQGTNRYLNSAKKKLKNYFTC